MDTAHILQFVDKVLSAKTGKHLNDLQRKIIEGILNRQKYSDIADTYGCTAGHAKDVGSSFCKCYLMLLMNQLIKGIWNLF